MKVRFFRPGWPEAVWKPLGSQALVASLRLCAGDSITTVNTVNTVHTVNTVNSLNSGNTLSTLQRATQTAATQTTKFQKSRPISSIRVSNNTSNMKVRFFRPGWPEAVWKPLGSKRFVASLHAGTGDIITTSALLPLLTLLTLLTCLKISRYVRYYTYSSFHRRWSCAYSHASGSQYSGSLGACRVWFAAIISLICSHFSAS